MTPCMILFILLAIIGLIVIISMCNSTAIRQNWSPMITTGVDLGNPQPGSAGLGTLNLYKPKLSGTNDTGLNNLQWWEKYSSQISTNLQDVIYITCPSLASRDALEYYGYTEIMDEMLKRLRPTLENIDPTTIQTYQNVMEYFGKPCAEQLTFLSGTPQWRLNGLYTEIPPHS